MASETEQNAQSTRWWEGYLVRYLIGTITGAGCSLAIALIVAGIDISSVTENSKIDSLGNLLTPILLLSLATGFLLCYVASTPITVIHAARMLGTHPSRPEWKPANMWMLWWLTSLAILIILSIANAFNIWLNYSSIVFLLILAIPATYVFFAQIAPMLALLVDADAENKKSTPGFWQKSQIKLLKVLSPEFSPGENKFVEKYHEIAHARAHVGTSDFRQTYTHLREHSNSIFIVALEISFTALIILMLIFGNAPTWRERIMQVCILVLLWIAPTIFIWSQANRLEMSLPKYVEKISKKAEKP